MDSSTASREIHSAPAGRAVGLAALSLDGEGALHRQVYRALRAAILEGRLAPGDRLASSRDLAHGAAVSRNTVLAAYEQLVAEGYARTRRGAGTFVAELPRSKEDAAARTRDLRPVGMPEISEYARRALDGIAPWGATWELPRRELRYDFRYGEPSFRDFPHETWARLVARRLRCASPARLSYGRPGGARELREALAVHLRRARGLVCSPDQIVVVRGAQQGIDLVGRVLLDPGAHVALEEPHYPGFRWALAALGARISGVPVDEEGLSVAALAELDCVRLCVVTPSHQYPTGVIMPLARRLALLDHAERAETWILEDDYDGEYRFDGPPVESLQGLDGGRRVLYLGTMSKVMFPSLRIGYLALPEPLVEPVLAANALADTGCPGIEQLALADFIREGHFERHLRRSRVRHAARREALLGALREELGTEVSVSGENAGLHLLLRLDGLTQRAAQALRRRAAEHDVGVYPAAPCYDQPPTTPAFLLGYSGLEPAEIREGVRRLAKLVREAS